MLVCEEPIRPSSATQHKPYGRCQVGIRQSDLLVLSRLSAVAEEHLRHVDLDMPLLQGDEAVSAVFVGVLLASDPEEAVVEQSEGGSKYATLRHAVAAKPAGNRSSRRRQSCGYSKHVIELEEEGDCERPK